jgi:2-polyprenyl-6-methoxyphenol hydroxylase-like FAD-dependent oxidoreductase
MSDRDYDALIVGARVAGSTLAALLGEAGYRVLLIDRARFPSPALSTHFFRGEGLVAVLDRLGVLDEVLALGSPPLVRMYDYVDGGTVPTVAPFSESGAAGFCLSVRREPLDNLLVQLAVTHPSVELSAGTRLLDLVQKEGRVVGARLMTPEGERSVRARIVVVADGRHSVVARAVGAPAEVEDPPIRGVFHRYVRGFTGPDGAEPDGAEFSQIEDELAYIFPSDAGVTCVALSVNLADFATMRTAPEAHFRARMAAHGGLAERFAAATPEGRQLGCGPEPSYVRVPVGPGWALVSDAGLHQDPWTGRGMDLAGTHATYLAEALHNWFSGTTTEALVLATYHERRNAHALPIYQETLTLGRDLRQLAQA